MSALLEGEDASALLARIDAAAGVGAVRRLPAADSAGFLGQLTRALSLLRSKRAAYDLHNDQLRTIMATRQLNAAAAVTAPAPAPAATTTTSVTPERRQHFISLVEKAVARTEYGSGSCRSIRAVDMPSTDLLYQLYTSLATARPALPAFGSLKIGREHSGSVLIPRKNGEPEGGMPSRSLQLAEFELLCWALAIAGVVAEASAGHEAVRLGDDGDGCLDLAQLATHPLNCRQVHQALRIAVAMARRQHALGSGHTSDPSAARVRPEDPPEAAQRQWLLRQEHIEKALATIAPSTALAAAPAVGDAPSALIGAADTAVVGMDVGPQTRSKPRAWQDVP